MPHLVDAQNVRTIRKMGVHRRKFPWTVTLALLAFAAGVTLSCDDENELVELSAVKPEAGPSQGDLGLQLRGFSGLAVKSIRWTIIRHGMDPIRGEVPSDGVEGFNMRLAALPEGDGYMIYLSALDGDGNVLCRGESGFRVSSNKVSDVTVNLSCGKPNDGIANNACPTIESLQLQPQRAVLGEKVTLFVDAQDSDPGDTLHYTWLDKKGKVLGHKAQETFRCLRPGYFSFNVRVHDRKCISSFVTAPLRCIEDESATQRCGDGIISRGEECDDGNTRDGDGCDSQCRIEACGNNRIDHGETCDDGNQVDGDGCSSKCLSEACGNGRLDKGEACDDGNNVAGDGCDPKCFLEVCGNGRLDANEQCDDGNTQNNDGCNEHCELERCGNGRIDYGEECDDGNTTAGDGCNERCQREVCGNGVIDVGEECDDGNKIPWDGCSPECKVDQRARCGDGVVHRPHEECDDGNHVSGDGCDASCRLETCGNGRLDPGEVCDDGNKIDDDGCTNQCVPN